MRLAMILAATLMTTNLAAEAIDLSKLEAGTKVHGFRTEAVYLNDRDEPFGARFVHENTGFTLDALQIETAPQGFIWVNSFPTSDKGEPHTQEHLLLGKGNVGRAVASLESMTLTDSSAFTMQWRTCYHFSTSAGPDVFYQLMDRQIDAMLHPDYTDEEIRREVRNIGVTVDPKTGKLGLEEKGTVYNEMVSSTDRAVVRLYYATKSLSWGDVHPLSFNSGGAPAAIREMTPEDIRTFHAETHHLAGMGMVGAYPSSMPLGEVLTKTGAMLDALEKKKERPHAVVKTEADLPPAQGAAPGTIRIVPYPLKNESQPSPVAFLWPASRNLDPADTLLLDLFLANVASDATTNMYKLLVDSSTRKLDTGARGVTNWSFSDMGQPFAIGLFDVSPDHMSEEKLREIRAVVTGEIERIASWPDGSPELAEFQKRMRSRVVETRRELANLVNSPPRFGARGTGSVWMEHLYGLGKTGRFERSVTMKPELAAIEKRLSGTTNIWRQLLADWKIRGVEPHAVAAKPSATLVDQDAAERQARLDAELARLKAKYGVEDDQDAIRRYKAEYDATTAELDRIASQVETPKFLEKPPLGLDDDLQWTTSKTKNGVPVFTTTFDTMTSATTSLMIDLDGVANDDLFLLSALPSLLTQVGVIVDGKPMPYEEMSERLRNEILSLDSFYSTNFRTGRAELAVRGSGNDVTEAKRAIDWMKLALASPDWRVDNLPRIRDVVDQLVGALRNRSQGSEESWVNEPAEAYRRQDAHVLLATDNFLTRAHNAHRLKWLLRDAGSDTSREAFIEYMDELHDAANDATREELATLAKVIAAGEGEAPAKLASLADSARFLPEEARANVKEVGKDLDKLIADLPDSSLAADWRYLVRQMKSDLLERPVHTLERLDRMRKALLRAGDARMVVVGAAATQKAIAPKVDELASALAKGSATPVTRSTSPLVSKRLEAREPDAAGAVFVGLVTPQLKGGVFLHSAKGWSYLDRDRNQLLDFLASRLYAGGGAHGIFMKTWGAGLAYSNGFRGSLSSGTFGYYAERTPELPQTLQFVIDEVKGAKPGEDLVEYAIALAFGGSRAASRYEARATAMADDLVDGLSPEVVAGFRKAVLDLRSTPGLHEELVKRMLPVYARVLPGLGGSVKNVPEGSFFVIGNDKQLAAWEQYLRTVEGPETKVWRLYPRDFWME